MSADADLYKKSQGFYWSIMDKSIFKSTFWKLTIRLELFTYLVNVPVAVYFSAVTGTLHEPIEFIYLSVGAAIAGSIGATAGIFWRWNFLKREIGTIQNENADIDSLIQSKVNLLKYPLLEPRVITIRWILAAACAHLLFDVFTGKVNTELHETYPFLMLLMLPLAYISFLYISEITIRTVYALPAFKKIEIGYDEIPQFSTLKRISISMVALMLLPLVVLGYMLIGMSNSFIKIENPFSHIGIMVTLFSIPVAISAYVCTKSIKNSISDVGDVLTELRKGNLDITCTPTAANEFGHQSHDLNQVILRLNSLYTEINNWNANLEKKIEERTRDLKNSFDEIQKLKLQQDGDYFLITLIVNPLGYNQVSKSNIEIEFFLEQKKKFIFKNKEHQIGGDICIADVVELKKKKYTVFINGDAMGKSIQGAGGALVLGVIFKSIVTRTQMLSISQDVYPEKWLKTAFIELQTAFESFDGSMLISVVMGLVDNQTGMMYYVNAEHPRTTVYRDGKASFIEDSMLFKIGVQGLRKEFIVRTFMLEPNDTIIIGSDGRDDLLIPSKTDRVINDDEILFLKNIEKGKGDLQKIVEEIKKTGELIDDLSLLKIHFKPSVKQLPDYASRQIIEDHLARAMKFKDERQIEKARHELYKAYKLDSNSKQTLHVMINFYRSIADHKEAALYSEKLSNLEPWDNLILLKTGYLYYKARQWSGAADFLERLHLRGNANSQSLLLLVKVHQRSENTKRASTLLDHVLKIDPNNSKALRIKNEIIDNKDSMVYTI